MQFREILTQCHGIMLKNICFYTVPNSFHFRYLLADGDRMIKITFSFLCLFLISSNLISRSTVEIGKASYYADKFHGRKTTSGEPYDKTKYTAAHKTLPFNTIVKITSKKDSKSVIVRINDRGPHVKKRIIDLSRIAAEKINLIKIGETQVTLQVIGKGKDFESPDQSAYSKEKAIPYKRIR